MGLVIYKKSDNQIMMENIQYPVYDTQIFEKFIASGNYNASDYGQVEIPQSLISEAMQKEIIIVNGQITFGEDRNPVVLEPLIPSEADALTDYIVDVDYRVTMIELGL